MRPNELPKRERAKQLRMEMSSLERNAWQILRCLPEYRFRRQVPFGPYILDFYSPKSKLCVEIDGPLHEQEDQRRHDAKRDRHLLQHGVLTLRFTEDELGKIERAVAAVPPRAGETS